MATTAGHCSTILSDININSSSHKYVIGYPINYNEKLDLIFIHSLNYKFNDLNLTLINKI